MNIKRWLVNKLGGITKEQQEETRSNYELWAVANLTGKNGEVTPDCLLYFPFFGDDIVVIRSEITICGGAIKGMKVAPWCKRVRTKCLMIENVHTKTEE